MVTNTIKNYFNGSGNPDLVVRNRELKQEYFVGKTVLLNGEPKGSIIPDDVDILVTKNRPEHVEYTDDDGNEGYEYTYEFGPSEFAGQVRTIALAADNFVDLRYANHINPVASGSSRTSFYKGDEYTGGEKIIDINFEDNSIIAFDYSCNWDGCTLKLKKYSKKFNTLRLYGDDLGYTASKFKLETVIDLDIDEIFDFGQTIDRNTQGNLYYAKDELNNRYVFVVLLPDKRINTAIIALRIDGTVDTAVYKMQLPEQINLGDLNFGYLDGTKHYGAMYKGRFCNQYLVTRSAEEAEITSYTMTSMAVENSTDIDVMETKYIYETNGFYYEGERTSQHAKEASNPLIGYGSGSFLSCDWTIKNDVAYIKQYANETTYNIKQLGFYHDGMIAELTTARGHFITTNYYDFNYKFSPFDLTIVEIPLIPIQKTLNRSMKYTFRIVNKESLWDTF